MNNKVWTLKEVAELFGVSESAVRHWCNYDSLTCFRTAGGHRRFRSEQIKAFMMAKGMKDENISPDGPSRLE